jgi:hypothetical protein
MIPQEPIELKCWSVPFQALKDGSKRFEYRKDDRPYEVGATLWQREWNPNTLYTGEELYHDITFIIRGGVFGIPEGYCIISTSEPRNARSNTPYCAQPHNCPTCGKACKQEKYHLVSETQLRDLHAWGMGYSPREPYNPNDPKTYPIPDGEKIIQEIRNEKSTWHHQIRMVVLNRLGDRMYSEFHAWRGPISGKEITSRMYKLIEEVMEEDGEKCH